MYENAITLYSSEQATKDDSELLQYVASSFFLRAAIIIYRW
jgi:hypothetical protein